MKDTSSTEATPCKRSRILAEASSFFAQRGFENTEVQAIADAAGVGKGTVYRYFGSKAELFMAAVDHGVKLLGLRVNQAAALAEDPLSSLKGAIEAYLGFFDEHPEVVELIIQERAAFRHRNQPTYFVHREQNIGQWHQLLLRMMEAGLIRECNEAVAADYISDLLYGMVFTKYFSGRSRLLADQAEEVWDMLLQGIAPGMGEPERNPG